MKQLRSRSTLGLVAATTVVLGALAAVSTAVPPESAVAGWPRQLGSAGYDDIQDVAVSSSGDVYVAGLTEGALPGQTSAGDYDVFVARYDKYGRQKWIRQIGTPAYDGEEIALVLSGSSLYIASATYGTFPGQTSAGDSDIMVARLSTSGTVSWIRQFGTAATDTTLELAVSGGSVYVTGNTYGTFPGQTAAGASDAYLARMSSSGNLQWVTQFGTDDGDVGRGVAASSGKIFVVGQTSGTFAGQTAGGESDGFIARFNSAGSVTAFDQFGGGDSEIAEDVAVSGSQVYVTGRVDGALPSVTPLGGEDAFLIRFDTSLNQVWSRQLGTSGNDTGYAVAVRSGRVVVSGQTAGTLPGFTPTGSYEVLLARYTTAGVEEWIRQFGTPGTYDGGISVALRSSDSYGGAVVVVGRTEGTVWGQVSAGAEDGFIATFLA
jgi:hypothetical protein